MVSFVLVATRAFRANSRSSRRVTGRRSGMKSTVRFAMPTERKFGTCSANGAKLCTVGLRLQRGASGGEVSSIGGDEGGIKEALLQWKF